MGLKEKVAPQGTLRRKLAGSVVRALRSAGPGKPRSESATLKRSWARHDPGALEEYLVSGYQNPRVNAQSMLMRHYLVRELFGDKFDALAHEELEHCVKATKALQARAKELGVKMGSFLNSEKRADVLRVSEVISDWEDTYEKRWAETLEECKADPIKVIEFACGSANDYRYFDSYGVARFLDYTGVDLNDNNIANAGRRFPGVDFQVQSILDLPFEDRSFEYVVANDIFEHLSLDAMEQAMHQATRLASKGIAITFFSMDDIPEHDVRPVRNYHWNVLSVPKIKELLESEFGPVEVIRIRDLLTKEFGFGKSYNKNAWTMFARREAVKSDAG